MIESRAIRQLANLIDAGLSPAQALKLINPPIDFISKPTEATFSGSNLSDPRSSTSEITTNAAIHLHWSIATELGAPIAPSLVRLADELDNWRENSRKIEIAFATPRLTAKLIAWLPVISIGLAQLLGLNPIGAIFSNGIALVAVIVGAGLLTAGHFWSNRLLLAAAPNSNDPGLFADCVAMALEAGLPGRQAKQETLVRFERALQTRPDELQIDQVEEALQISASTGAAGAGILKSFADQQRRDKQFAELNQITKLNVKLLLPIGITILPAFGLLTIVPVAVGFLVGNK